jgi:protein involved in polysaccharide export with SLBB domain
LVPALLLPLLLLAGCYSPEAASPNPANRFPLGDVQPGPGGTNRTPLPPTVVGQPLDVNGAVATIGDALTVSFSDLPPINSGMPPESRVRVGPDGTITLPLNIIIHCLGKTAPELQKEIRAAYVPGKFVNLTAAVKFEDRYYFVGGEVRIPQRLIYFGQGITVLRAIDSAGGFTDFSKRTKIEVRRANGQTEWVNWDKARKDPRLDLPVFPNDQIIVHKKNAFGA